MKKELLTRTATVLMIAITALAGCKKDELDDDSVKNITMTTAIEGEVAIYLAGTGDAVIDWGDGSALDTVTLSVPDVYGYRLNTFHTFPGTVPRTIVIEGQDITHLICADMQLTTLDVSKNTMLIELWCNHNQLTALDVTKNTVLISLTCNNNQLANLNVTKNTVLGWLSCGWNQLTSLDVTKNNMLNILQCQSNQLTNLDASKNTMLIELWCRDNRLTVEGLNALFGTLHNNARYRGKTIYIKDNPGATDCDRSIAENRVWTVYD